MFYRFNNGTFVEADNFADAQAKLIKKVSEEVEVKKQWHVCTCVAFQN